jgi:hypothetical protein
MGEPRRDGRAGQGCGGRVADEAVVADLVSALPDPDVVQRFASRVSRTES